MKPRHPMSRGRWQLERERFQIEAETPPAPFVEAQPIREAIQEVLSRLPPPPPSWYEEMEAEWSRLVGETVARHARPGRLSRRALTVFVDSSVWLHEMDRFHKAGMLAALQARFGAQRIPALVLRLDPDRGRGE